MAGVDRKQDTAQAQAPFTAVSLAPATEGIHSIHTRQAVCACTHGSRLSFSPPSWVLYEQCNDFLISLLRKANAIQMKSDNLHSWEKPAPLHLPSQFSSTLWHWMSIHTHISSCLGQETLLNVTCKVKFVIKKKSLIKHLPVITAGRQGKGTLGQACLPPQIQVIWEDLTTTLSEGAPKKKNRHAQLFESPSLW